MATFKVMPIAPTVDGGQPVGFAVVRENDMAASCAVEWRTVPGTDAGQQDEQAGVSTFDVNDWSEQIWIATKTESDRDLEVTVELFNAMGGEITLGQATVKVVYPTVDPGPDPEPPEPPDPEPELPVISIAAVEKEVIEGGPGQTTEIVFRATRTGPTDKQSKVTWTRGGTLDAEDWEKAGLTGTMTFDVNVTERDIIWKLKGDATVEGDEMVTATLSDPVNCTIGEASAAAIVKNDDPDDSGGGSGGNGGDDDDKPPLRVLRVENNAELERVLLATAGAFHESIAVDGTDRSAPLRPGDAVKCKPGTYAGLHRVKQDGSGNLLTGKASHRIWIEGDGNGDCIFTGGFVVDGAWVGLRGLETRGKAKIMVNAPGVRVTKHFLNGTTPGTGQGAIMNNGSDIRHFRFDHSDAKNITSAAVWMEVNPNDKYEGAIIERNMIDGHTADSSNEAVYCYLTDSFSRQRVSYLYNLFRGCMKKTGNKPGDVISQKELISGKTGNLLIKGNTLEDCNGGRIVLRQTQGCEVEDNWSDDNVTSIFSFGDGHRFKNNNMVLELRAGDAYTGDDPPAGCEAKAKKVTIRYNSGRKCEGAQCASRKVIAENNGKAVKIGTNYGPEDNFKAREIVLRKCPKASITASHVVLSTIEEIDVGQQDCTARKLLPAEVGRSAA